MIITRSPLRVSLGGGGTDLPSYYREFGGFLVAAAIDKYVYRFACDIDGLPEPRVKNLVINANIGADAGQ
jgi:galactokinase/mevalonate kinase-like predicted kinase